MTQRSELTLDDGVKLSVEIDGPAGADLTVVLLHGWCQDKRTWQHQRAALRRLGSHRPRVIAYDTRGHGRSGATRLDSATLGRLGDDLAAVLARYAPSGPLVLAGHSLGGMTIMEYAHRNPDQFADRVAGLLFASTTAEGHTHTRYGLPEPLAALMRAGETIGAGVLARSGAWCPQRALLPALRPAARWLLLGDGHPGDALDITMRCFARTTLRSIGGFRASIGAQQRLDTLAALGDVPAAVLVGQRDRLTPPACAESIAAALPHATLTVLPRAGHMLPLERPDEVSAALAAIVKQATRGLGAQRRRAARARRAAAHEQAA
ncbi:alpha/beta hydrolase [Actinoplanes bogorensis]|uniref:Alpha/beta hydrolase n=1 Tax=Paractinoplanes bogorensis TaxID=1610840 RepID=A0ABS5Z4P3_9ACTN|nr:alpha/beta hydrolase [Actinoplanes bogorensis]MBU2670618.1 alpha/beta hydrolase [Actinoplanes bogorensis]